MKLHDLLNMPTVVNASSSSDYRTVHESCLRSYHLVLNVIDWLKAGVPASMIIELIDFVMSAESKELEAK